MKEKVIIFMVGLLVGAIISTGSIYFYTLANSSNSNAESGMQMNNGMPGTPPTDQNGQMNGGTPPEMPNNNSQNNNQTNNNQTNTNQTNAS